MSKKAIVSLATKNSRYVDGLARLSNSLRDNASDIDFLGFIHEKSVGSPFHVDNPYSFKMHSIQTAINAGYTEILWLDTSVWAVAPVHPIFDIISEQGYFFEGNGCFLGEWCSDKVLYFYKIGRDAAMDIPMAQGGFMGFNFNNLIGEKLFSSLTIAYNADLFKGDWNNEDKSVSNDNRVKGHRHEQSCMSAIIHTLGIPFSHNAEYVQYGGMYDKIISEKVIFKCQGI